MSGYIPNVPLGNQTISSSLSPINTNFTVANTAFAVDHTALITATSQGMHQKVSLVQQSGDPLPVSTTPIIYSKQTSYPGPNNRTDIYAIQASGDGGNVIALTNFFANVITNLGGFGSTFLPGSPSATSAAIIIKYGSITQTGTVPHTFIGLGVGDFPNNCFFVLATISNAVGGTKQYVYTGGYSNTGFTATTQDMTNQAGVTATFGWIAIGF